MSLGMGMEALCGFNSISWSLEQLHKQMDSSHDENLLGNGAFFPMRWLQTGDAKFLSCRRKVTQATWHLGFELSFQPQKLKRLMMI